ncbi:hypothetical protein Ocin01_19408 [Orchesella cincta]|uniref:Uncharacterized protein n=1 Tax=Orchesella cincta TaxID=48709 RepID=A0A1D2M2S6_ORCCI|nr:hypothetical protein Ocin01_19408 [Orchesella cincta]
MTVILITGASSATSDFQNETFRDSFIGFSITRLLYRWTIPNEVKRVDRFQKSSYNGVSRKAVFPFRRQDDDDDSSSSSSSSNSDGSTKSSGDSKFKDLRVPMLNFYSSVPNTLGFVGFIFIPDLTQVGLPLFYPGGGDLDKLPTLQDLADLANFDFVKQAGQLFHRDY